MWSQVTGMKVGKSSSHILSWEWGTIKKKWKEILVTVFAALGVILIFKVTQAYCLFLQIRK